MAKPSGSVCNIDCQYCFYLEKEKLYPERQKKWMMDQNTLTLYIQQQIESQPGMDVDFAWQGGEPTIMGLDFFRKAIEIQQQFAGNKRIHNTIQTNGILINDEWCQFFKLHNILVGISIDGPADLHDAYRVNRAGKPTHQKVMAAIELLKKHGVEFNTLTVVNDLNASEPERVYEFLISIGSRYLQFIPLVERQASKPTNDGLYLISPEHDTSANVTSWSVPSHKYGEFLNRIFDIWVTRDVGRIFVQMFDNTLASWCGAPSPLCIFAETCGHAFALESNGDLYNCDHYVYPEHKLGNIHSVTISEMNNSDQAIKFGLNKKEHLSNDCLQCRYKFACNGGCPKHRFINSSSGKRNHNYFCQGYYSFFKHSEQRMRIMANLLSHQQPAADIMYQLHQQKEIAKHQDIGRNDPCPCGSNKKYKKCCWR